MKPMNKSNILLSIVLLFVVAVTAIAQPEISPENTIKKRVVAQDLRVASRTVKSYLCCVTTGES